MAELLVDAKRDAMLQLPQALAIAMRPIGAAQPRFRLSHVCTQADDDQHQYRTQQSEAANQSELTVIRVHCVLADASRGKTARCLASYLLHRCSHSKSSISD